MHPPAPTPHRVLVVLGRPHAHLWDLVLLVAVGDPQILRPGQVVPTVADTLGEPVGSLIRVIDESQVRPRRPGLLSRRRFGPPPRRFVPSGAFRPGPSFFEHVQTHHASTLPGPRPVPLAMIRL